MYGVVGQEAFVDPDPSRDPESYLPPISQVLNVLGRETTRNRGTETPRAEATDQRSKERKPTARAWESPR